MRILIRLILVLFLFCFKFVSAQHPALEVDIEYSVDSSPFRKLLSLEFDQDLRYSDAIIKFKWRASNSRYVLIEGYDTLKHSTNDSIISAGGSFNIIAVGEQGIVRKICGAHTILRNTGAGGDAMHYFLHSGLNTLIYFMSGFTFEITTNKSLEEIKRIISQVLQSKGYTVDVQKEISRMTLTEFILSTEQYNENDKLCKDKEECKTPIGERRFERKISFSVWVKNGYGSQNEVSFTIKPSVLSRWRREEGDWKKDPEEILVSKEVCSKLMDEISEVINKK